MGNEEALGTGRLLALIDAQNRIASAKLDLDAVMNLVVEQAALLTKASGAVVEIVQGDEMIVRAAAGSALSSVGQSSLRGESFSGLAVEKGDALDCADASEDDRDGRAECRALGALSMISAPLSHHGRAVGALTIRSPDAHAFGPGDKELLGLLAAIVAASMEHAEEFGARDRQSRIDGLTSLPNRRAFDERLSLEVRLSKEQKRPLSLALLDLEGLTAVGKRLGASEGDHILREVSKLLREETDEMDACFRMSDDAFAILMPNTRADDAIEVVKRCAEAVCDAEMAKGAIGISAGVAESDGEPPADFQARANRRLQQAKIESKSGGSARSRDYHLSFPPSLRAPPIG